MVYFAAEGSDEIFVVRLRPSEDKRIDVIGLATESRTDVDALFAKVREAGCKIIFEPKVLPGLGGGYGFRFFNPDGLPFEISAEVARGSARELVRWEGIPQKISHIVMHSPDHKAAVQFFVDVLGFKVSDWLGDFMGFLRCNEWHHRIAFLPGPPCFNHIAYDMLTVDDMMRGVSRLRKQDVDIKWGPGRHTAGNNTFSYFVTPNGFTVEYTAELEKVDWETHEAQVHVPGPQVMDQWGTGVGGPQTMPHPEPDKGLFQPAGV
jgi:catechol 2,3-dioxygenase-like lactoylglutathione lyase family enzyme